MSVARRTETGRLANVRALQRGLEILRVVNASGGIRAGAVARALGVPRPTVYRLLQTLEELGFVVRGASNDLFRVTRRAAGLGDGYDASVLVARHAGPVLLDLRRRFVWPFDLCVYENAAMVIQETTHSLSPLSIDRGMVGRRLPMVRTSSGRCYLAFCPAEERQVILRHVTRLEDPDDAPFLEPRALDRLLAQTVERGYAVRDGGEYNPRTASLAVPILREDVVIGTISCIWIRSAMTQAEAVEQLVAPLREAATSVLERISAED